MHSKSCRNPNRFPTPSSHNLVPSHSKLPRRKRSSSRGSLSSDSSSISSNSSFKLAHESKPRITERLIIFTAAVFCFWRSYDGQFVFDDEEAVVNNKDVLGINPVTHILKNDYWGTLITSNASHKSYRPITTLTFRLNHEIGGLDVRGFHIVNIFLHGIASLLVHQLYSKIVTEQRSSSFYGGLLFAMHPVHTECVANICGRAELLCCIFYVAAILSYDLHIKSGRIRYLLGTVALTALSMFSKEQGVSALAICMVYDILVHLQLTPRIFYDARISSSEVPVSNNEAKINLKELNMGHISRSWGWLIISTIVLLLTRMSIMSFTSPVFSPPDNPASFLSSVLWRGINYIYLYCLNLWLLLNPSQLCFDYSMGCIPCIQSFMDPRILAVGAFILAFLSLTYQFLFLQMSEKMRLGYFSLALIIVPFLPSSNLFFRVGFVLAERILYLPSIGFCLLLALAIQFLPRIQRKGLLALVFVLFLTKCVQRTDDWRTQEALYSSGLQVCPQNAKVHYNLAKVLSDAGQVSHAQIEYREALRLRPNYERAMNNLANLLKDHGVFEEAERLLINALLIKPSFAAAWMNLGIVRSNLKKYSLAEEAYFRALNIRQPYADCWFNLGNVYLQQGRNSEAMSAWINATSQKPTHAKAWINKMVMLDSEGSCERAISLGHQALNYNPNHGGIHFTIGGCYGKLGEMENAQHHLVKAIDSQPQNANYYGNLGVLYHRWNRTAEAKELYEKALSLNEHLDRVRDNLRLLKSST